MIPWRLLPFARPCFALIAGILCREYFVLPSGLVVFVFFLLILLSVLNDFFYLRSVLYPMVAGYVIMGLYFLLGHLAHSIHLETTSKMIGQSSLLGGKQLSIIGVVQEYPDEQKKFKTTIDVSWICADSICVLARQSMLISFRNKKILPVPGDKVWIKGTIHPIASNTNPGCFDYAQYMRRQGIVNQFYPEEEMIRLDKNKLGIVKQAALSMRDKCLAILDKYLSGDEKAVAKAMILGYRQEVDDALYQSFSRSGAMHILAVSGMHLAIIANLIMILIQRWKNRILPMLWVLAILWFFSFMTGAESAIVRSALMFSLILYGKTLRYHHSTYNVMAFCAMAMLLYQTGQLFNAGFLFSFLALLSLLYFQPVIEHVWTPNDRFSYWVWQYVAASIAAQILVAPLTVFLFHQFPLYFILSGFIPVWVSAMALKLGLLVFMVEAVCPILNNLFAGPLHFSFWFFIQSVLWIESLPHSSLSPVFLTVPEFVLSNAGIAGLIWMGRQGSAKMLYMVISCFVATSTLILVRKIQQQDQMKITFYDSPQSPLLDVFVGTKCMAYGDSLLLAPKASYIFKNHRDRSGIRQVFYFNESTRQIIKTEQCQFQPDSFQIGHSLFIFLTNECSLNAMKEADVCLVSTGVWPPKTKLYTDAQFILDASVYGRRLEAWKTYLSGHRLSWYAVHDSGAFVFENPFSLKFNEK